MAKGGKDVKHNESCGRHDYEPFFFFLTLAKQKVKVLQFFHVIILFFSFYVMARRLLLIIRYWNWLKNIYTAHNIHI